MIFTPLPLEGAWKVTLDQREDSRGFFARVFCAREFGAHDLNTEWVQVNASFSRAEGTLRGLHFQRPPMAEVKLVRCVSGAIYDVIVDLRAGSPTYGQWTGLELSAQNGAMIYIPRGFAHGFQTLRPDTELLYFHSQYYSPAHEGGLHHADPALGINWPRPVADLSPRDAGFAGLETLDPIP
ncbi:dTDP-4-dehydrorhamnose 3,5-epimerase [Rhodovulum bhavnagarense]|uniref:dTDP-4-dehydrorhamnose 3,5-epimerase n=1 Tax=Rhodovulum bhavnagarense TaxID=992286 RepID=A0A4R2RKP9_9RHOB|nr:dTDP-4-dehydrorhamnose 3,5-epimerase [Rhodovulum bhavnagarense]TCP59805.1 dTDP-4-dehydrorhamnose 3,5-epimerase [Rhodovulum bhavnagarense]